MLCDALCKLMGDLPGENNSATLKKMFFNRTTSLNLVLRRF